MEPVDGQQGGIFSNPWVKYGLVAVVLLAMFVVLRRGSSSGTSTGPAVSTVPDTNNLSTLSNLENAVQQDYTQNQQFQQQFLGWLQSNQSQSPPQTTPSAPPPNFDINNPTTWYEVFAGREPDAGGLANWQRDISQEGTQVAFANFMAEPEIRSYVAGHPTVLQQVQTPPITRVQERTQ